MIAEAAFVGAASAYIPVPGAGMGLRAGIGALRTATQGVKVAGQVAAGVGKAGVAAGKEVAEEGFEAAAKKAIETAGSKGLLAVDGLGSNNSLYKVGPYDEIKGTAPGLNAHHVGQKAIFGKWLPATILHQPQRSLYPELGTLCEERLGPCLELSAD